MDRQTGNPTFRHTVTQTGTDRDGQRCKDEQTIFKDADRRSDSNANRGNNE